MNSSVNHDDDEWADLPPSKTRLKKDMLALQELAVELTQLNREQLAQIPLTPELLKAIDETHNIKKHEALRRHRQYLGRLMRASDHRAIGDALLGIKEKQDRMNRLFHQMESWRDQLIQGDQQTLETFIEAHPHSDRQQLRYLVRNAKQEFERNRSAAAGHTPQHTQARKLFRFVRDLIANEPDE